MWLYPMNYSLRASQKEKFPQITHPDELIDKNPCRNSCNSCKTLESTCPHVMSSFPSPSNQDQTCEGFYFELKVKNGSFWKAVLCQQNSLIFRNCSSENCPRMCREIDSFYRAISSPIFPTSVVLISILPNMFPPMAMILGFLPVLQLFSFSSTL